MPIPTPDDGERRAIIAYLHTLHDDRKPAHAPAAAAGKPSRATAPAEPVNVGQVRQDKAAFGDYRDDAPGVRRHITVAALPPPFATDSSSNGPRVVAAPPRAMLRVPAGFTVTPFAHGLDHPRALRVAPNGDILITESEAGRVRVIRAKDGASAPEQLETFASKLDRPFGVAFYPPGPSPRFVYVAENNRVIRYPYGSGDLHARGPAETIVAEAHRQQRGPLDARPRLLRRRQAAVRLRRLRLQRRRRHVAAAADQPRRLGSRRRPGRHLGRRAPSRRRPRLRSRGQGRQGLRQRHPQLRRPRRAAGDARPVVLDQRARRPRRQPRARLRDPGARRRLLRLALVLPRRARGSAAQGRAPRSGRQGDRARRAPAGALGLAGDDVLRRQRLPRGLSRRRLRGAPRLVEPRHPHRLQSGPHPHRARRAHRRVRGLPGRLRRRPGPRLGPRPSASPSPTTARYWSAKTATARSGASAIPDTNNVASAGGKDGERRRCSTTTSTCQRARIPGSGRRRTPRA